MRACVRACARLFVCVRVCIFISNQLPINLHSGIDSNQALLRLSGGCDLLVRIADSTGYDITSEVLCASVGVLRILGEQQPNREVMLKTTVIASMTSVLAAFVLPRGDQLQLNTSEHACAVLWALVQVWGGSARGGV